MESGSIAETGARGDERTHIAQRRRRTGSMVAAIVVVPLVAAYAVLWIGGAIEILTYEDDTAGSSCTIIHSVSSAEVGKEADRWVGGGLLWRPGVVCVPQPAPRSAISPEERAQLSEPAAWSPPYEARRLTQADVISAAVAALVFAGATAGVEAWFRRND